MASFRPERGVSVAADCTEINVNHLTEADYIASRLNKQIEWYSDKSSKCQARFKKLKKLELLLSLSLPVIVGLIPSVPWLTISVAIIGAAITFIVAVQSLEKHHEIWIEYRFISEALKHERILYQTQAGPYETENPFQVLVERAEKIMATERIGWIKQQISKD